MHFVGLCLIALAINSGFSELARAIRFRRIDIKFTDPLRVEGERRNHGPSA